MRNAELEEAQSGIKIAGRNINNLRYADDTTLMAESKELKSLLMKVKVNVHCSTVYNSQDMEATWMSTGRQMDKKVVVHIHNGISLSH